MTGSKAVTLALALLLGSVIGAGMVEYWHRARFTAAAATVDGTTTGSDNKGGSQLEELRAEVARLQAVVPSQSHTMADVGYHWTNLWFAAEKKNWPLATFYFDEAREHILWTIRIRPVRKAPDGSDVGLEPIFQAIDSSALKAVREAIQDQNSAAFATAYRTTLEACYGCHKASGKAYLRPVIPAAPAQALIAFEPG